ncbi:MAG: hypothetical protein SPL58_08070 [Bacteroidaceae bacterium]|nr:hypothetical protein [Bacteroidaceae bacterium]
MTKTSFCGIFATLFLTTTMVLLASCSQDDDYYESDMYTLAEMGTRLGGGGDPGNGEAPTPKPPKEYPYSVRKNNQTIEVNNVTTSNANFDLDFVVDSAFTTLRCEVKPYGNFYFVTTIPRIVWDGNTVCCDVKVVPFLQTGIEGTALYFNSEQLTKEQFGMNNNN